MKIWILMKGEDHEGGFVHGVYLDKDYARADFEKLAKQISRTFRIDEAFVADDGSINVHAGCDWLTLEPHDVQGPLALPAAVSVR